MPWGFIILFVLVAVALIGAGIYLEHKRREMWRQIAARYGFRYTTHDPFDLPNRYSFALFKQGHSRRASNCLEGVHDGLPVILFDYRYTTGSGKNQSTHHVSALLARLDVHCPRLTIRPENVMDKFAAFLGFDDIDFEYDRFNRAFHVNGDDKKFAYDVCHSDMMEFLLEHPSMTWELRGGDLLLYSWTMGTFDADEVDRCLGLAKGFVERIPDYLREARS